MLENMKKKTLRRESNTRTRIKKSDTISLVIFGVDMDEYTLEKNHILVINVDCPLHKIKYNETYTNRLWKEAIIL